MSNRSKRVVLNTSYTIYLHTSFQRKCGLIYEFVFVFTYISIFPYYFAIFVNGIKFISLFKKIHFFNCFR